MVATMHPARRAVLDEIRRLERNTSRKIGRLRRNGANDKALSKVDPRNTRPAGTDLRALRRYAARLERFTARQTRYAIGSQGALLSWSKWLEYTRVERKLNKKRAREFASIADIPTPAGMTVRQYFATFRPDRPHMTTPERYDRFMPLKRKPRSIKSDKALDKLIAKVRFEATDKRREQRLDNSISGIRKMIKTVIDSGYLSDADKATLRKVLSMSRGQYDALWNFTNRFANAVSLWYLISQNRMLPREKQDLFMLDVQESVRRNSSEEIAKYVKWASKLKI